MKKEYIIKQEIKKVKVYCDDCSKEISHSLACCVARCMNCGKDLCEKCIAHENNTGGDWREVYCKFCWSVEQEYSAEIAELHKQIDDIRETIYSKCKSAKESHATMKDLEDSDNGK